MTLELNGLEVACIIGELPEERTRVQCLRLDVALAVDSRAAETDELRDTVDYAALSGRLRDALVEARCRMIERAARIALDVCLADAKVRSARVRVTKSGSVAALASASVTLEASKS